jgi:hypothetical protein
MLDWLKKLFGGKSEEKAEQATETAEAPVEMGENTKEASSSDEMNQ